MFSHHYGWSPSQTFVGQYSNSTQRCVLNYALKEKKKAFSAVNLLVFCVEYAHSVYSNQNKLELPFLFSVLP